MLFPSFLRVYSFNYVGRKYTCDIDYLYIANRNATRVRILFFILGLIWNDEQGKWMFHNKGGDGRSEGGGWGCDDTGNNFNTCSIHTDQRIQTINLTFTKMQILMRIFCQYFSFVIRAHPERRTGPNEGLPFYQRRYGTANQGEKFNLNSLLYFQWEKEKYWLQFNDTYFISPLASIDLIFLNICWFWILELKVSF